MCVYLTAGSIETVSSNEATAHSLHSHMDVALLSGQLFSSDFSFSPQKNPKFGSLRRLNVSFNFLSVWSDSTALPPLCCCCSTGVHTR